MTRDLRLDECSLVEEVNVLSPANTRGDGEVVFALLMVFLQGLEVGL